MKTNKRLNKVYTLTLHGKKLRQKEVRGEREKKTMEANSEQRKWLPTLDTNDETFKTHASISATAPGEERNSFYPIIF